MCWLYVPGLEALNSESELPNLPRVASLTWRGRPMPQRFFPRGWKKGPYTKLLSGLTLPLSTLDRGAALWIASLQATRASPTVLPESEAEPATTDSLSIKCFESSKSAGLIVYSVRTCRGTRMDNSALSSLHWKDWATALRQEYSARKKLRPATDGNVCSSWPTPMAGSPGTEKHNAAGNNDFSRLAMGLAEGLAQQWATPKTITGGANSKRKDRGAGGADLQEMVSSWPTPAMRDHKGSNSLLHVTKTGTGRKHMDQLANFAVHRFHSSPPDLAMPDGQPSSREPRSLNPRFVEWLMGWPIGWTSFDCAETGLSAWLLRMRGVLSTLCSPVEPIQRELFDD